MSREERGKRKEETVFHCRSYRVRYKSVEEGSKAEEKFVSSAGTEEKDTALLLPMKELTVDLPYKVNVYAIVTESSGAVIESKELHGKVGSVGTPPTMLIMFV